MADGVVPSGTVTFLFTDVEGSTRLWEGDQAQMTVALARHERLVSAAIEANTGYVFSTAGDSFAAAFPRVVDAMTAALQAQRALVEERWPAGAAIRVRMGIHTGEAEERDGDYFGPDVNRTARLMEAGHGGQVLVSTTSARLLAPRLPDGAELRSRGIHRLKDLASPEEIFELAAPGVPVVDRPLRTIDGAPAPRTNLPEGRDRFVGRVDDLRRVLGRLDEHQLVTLTAIGGTGKTRLAVHAAAEWTSRCRDGVWLVELSGMEPDESVAARIGAAVGFDVREGSTWLATATEWLSVKEILIVLDNCEHVVADAARVSQAVLSAGAGVRILATSREPLGVRGEAVVRLAPLDPGSEGRELFIDRATEVDDRFEVGDREADIAELCRRLDGLPLAIELAAAHARTLTPAEIVELLDRRFELLRTRDRSAGGRHRTLRETIEWSYELLSDDARHLFDRLSVFLGPFDVDATAAIAGPSFGRFEVFELIEELEAKSLLESRLTSDRARYHLLETVAAFGRDRLRERGDEPAVLELHGEYFMDVTMARIDEIQGLGPHAAAARVPTLVRDFEETRRALRWAVHEQPDRALEVAVALSVFLASLRELRVAATLRNGVLDELAPDDGSGSAYAISAILGLADYDNDRLRTNAQAALATTSSPGTRALALSALCWSDLVMNGDRESGLRHIDEALVELRSSGDEVMSAAIVGPALVVMCHHAGQPEHGREVFESLVEPDREVSPLWAISAMEAAAHVYRFVDLERSSAHITDAIELAEPAGLTNVRRVAQYMLALNQILARDNVAAFDTLVNCLPGLLDEGEALVTALALEDLAPVLARSGHLEEALVCLAAGVAEGERRRASGPAVFGGRRDRLRARGERELGAPVAADAWRRGSAMTLDAAVAWATQLGERVRATGAARPQL